MTFKGEEDVSQLNLGGSGNDELDNLICGAHTVKHNTLTSNQDFLDISLPASRLESSTKFRKMMKSRDNSRKNGYFSPTSPNKTPRHLCHIVGDYKQTTMKKT
jgi:hypothetical protein